jgi:hypothetical protein
MPVEATKFLRWNGICAVDPVNHPGRCNANGGGARPTAPPVRELSARPSVSLEEGISAELMRFEVNVLEVYRAITAAEEYIPIRVRFRAVDELRSMVLQIRDSAGRLVYAERLPADQVWGLPDAFDEAAVPARWTANDAERKAVLDNAPYTVSVLVTRGDGPIALDLTGDPPDDTILRSPIPVGARVPRLDRVLVRKLTIVSIDHHFAPSRAAATEALAIGYETGCIGDRDVMIEIWSPYYEDGGMLIYQERLADTADGVHVLRWNGEANCGGGALAGNKLINPLYSPYMVKLRCAPLMLQSAERSFNVLYHSIRIALGTYLEDPLNPPPQAATAAYVQHKLNELGYFAGPPVTALNDQIRRALRRYTYALPNLLEGDRLDQSVLVGLDPKPTVVDVLAANTGQRTLFQHANCIPDGVDSRIYIDCDYFYVRWDQFSNDDGHSRTDQMKLDRFEVPIEATVYLVSRLDLTPGPNGVLAGEAAGPVGIEWTLVDPPEDTAIAPTATANGPSRTRAYLTKTLTATAGAAGDATNPQDNCPSAGPNRGFRGAQNHFRIGDVLPPFRGTANGGAGVISKVHQDDGAHPHKVGKSGVLFQGSYVAGDNYIVEARLTFADLGGRRNALEALHVAYNTDDATFDEIESLRRRTGKMTIWRRRTIAAVVDWPAPSANAIDWNAVKPEYAIAHVELDTSAVAAANVQTLMATKGLGAVQNKMIFEVNADGHPDHMATPGADYQPDQVYCGPPLPAQGAEEEGHAYITRVDALLRAYLSSDYLCDVSLFIRNNLLQEEKAGQVTMRVNWHRPITVYKRFKPFGKVVASVSSTYRPGLFCIGLAGGVTMLENGMMAQHADRFLVTHEIGHCLHLNHHETVASKNASDTPAHHDTADHNCVMCYPWGIASRNPPTTRAALSWEKNSASIAHFCGKCVLKLRGWDIVGVGLPDDST